MSKFPQIDKWLAYQGINPHCDPLYRMVWSEDQLEHRFGYYNDYSESGLWLREVNEVRLVKKYSYIDQRWILEKWFAQGPTKELPNPNGYEPFWVFEDGNGNYIGPSLKAVEFIVNISRTEVQMSHDGRRFKIANYYAGRSEREVQEIEDSLDISEMQISLRHKEGVGYTKGLKHG